MQGFQAWERGYGAADTFSTNPNPSWAWPTLSPSSPIPKHFFPISSLPAVPSLPGAAFTCPNNRQAGPNTSRTAQAFLQVVANVLYSRFAPVQRHNRISSQNLMAALQCALPLSCRPIPKTRFHFQANVSSRTLHIYKGSILRTCISDHMGFPPSLGSSILQITVKYLKSTVTNILKVHSFLNRINVYTWETRAGLEACPFPEMLPDFTLIECFQMPSPLDHSPNNLIVVLIWCCQQPWNSCW